MPRPLLVSNQPKRDINYFNCREVCVKDSVSNQPKRDINFKLSFSESVGHVSNQPKRYINTDTVGTNATTSYVSNQPKRDINLLFFRRHFGGELHVSNQPKRDINVCADSGPLGQFCFESTKEGYKPSSHHSCLVAETVSNQPKRDINTT